MTCTHPHPGALCGPLSHVKLIFEIFHGNNGSWGLKIELHTFHDVSYNFIYVVREESEGKKSPVFRRALELPSPRGSQGAEPPRVQPRILAFWRVIWRHWVALEHCGQKIPPVSHLRAFFLTLRQPVQMCTDSHFSRCVCSICTPEHNVTSSEQM